MNILSNQSQSMPKKSALKKWFPLYYLTAAVLLLVLQLIMGTEPAFASLVFVFTVLTYFAVKAAGGLTSLFGACIAFMAAQNVIVSQIAKVAFGQAADTVLKQPVMTIGVYDVAMAGIWLAAALSTSWTARRVPLFATEMDVSRLMWFAYITTVIALYQVVMKGNTVNADTEQINVGGIQGIVNQVSFIIPLATAAGTAFIILRSKGQRSIGIVNGLMILAPMAWGFISGNRESFVTTIIVYISVCIFFKFKFRLIHYLVLIVGACIMQFILFPYALYARNVVRTPRLEENIRRAAVLLGDIVTDPSKYQNIVANTKTDPRYIYYGKYMPTLDRSSLIIFADGIIDATQRQGTIGMETITPGFSYAVPRIFYPEKPVYIPNTLAHREPGLVGKNDFTTGITLGFVCDSFSSFGWVGAFVIPFLISFFLFASYRLVINNSLWFNIVSISLLFHLSWVFSGMAITPMIVEILQNVITFIVIYGGIMILVNLATRTELRIRQTRQLYHTENT